MTVISEIIGIGILAGVGLGMLFAYFYRWLYGMEKQKHKKIYRELCEECRNKYRLTTSYIR